MGIYLKKKGILKTLLPFESLLSTIFYQTMKKDEMLWVTQIGVYIRLYNFRKTTTHFEYDDNKH